MRAADRNRRRGARVALCAAALAMAGAACLPATASAGKIVDRIVAGQPFSGSLGAMFNQPRGLAVKHNGNGPADAGDVYVADYGNHRIQQFDSSGNFIRAFGQDTIAATVNEQQLVRVTATAGTYTLSFDGATTAPIPFDAFSPQIDDALDLLSTIDGDANVTVNGQTEISFTVTFAGKFAAANQPQMTVDDSQLTGNVAIETLADGTATTADTGTGIESCEVAQHCKSGTISPPIGGAFNNPTGVAIDQSDGHLFVYDRENGRVQEFEADGSFVKAWGWGVATGAAAFEVCTTQATCLAGRRDQAEGNGNGGQILPTGGLGGFTGIAIVPTGPANAGNVMIAEGGNRRVQEFDPSQAGAAVFVRLWGWDVVATGQTGNIDSDSFEICTSALLGVCKTAAAQGPAASRPIGRFGTAFPRDLAIDSEGLVYAINVGLNNSWRIDSFDTSQLTPALLPKTAFSVFQVVGGSTNTASESLDIDPATGNLLIARNDEAIRVAEIVDPSSPSASLTDTHYLNSGLSGSGIALDPDSEDLYLAQSGGGGHRIFAADADGAPPALMEIDPPSAVGSRTATLNGKVNPDGLFATSWRLQYSLDGVSWSNAGSGTIPAGTTDVPVSAVATGLRPNSLYQTRLATNQEFGNPEFTSAGLDFTTDPEPPEIAATRADSITDTSARLTARVNPHNSETVYHFKWGQGDFANTIPIPDAPLGAGPAFLFAAQQLSDLEPDTTYQFKVVATNLAVGAAEGPTRIFTTSAVAPGDDSRAFELVSPADKSGPAGLGSWYVGPESTFPGGMAAYSGERFAANSHFGGTLLGDADFAYSNDVALAERVSDAVGWQSHSAVSNPAWGSQVFRGANPQRGASDDLALMGWETNGGLLKPFSEIAEWTDQLVKNPLFLGDWQGRWEIFGPNSPEPWNPFPPYPQQVEVGTDSEPGGGDKGTAIAANGGYAVATTSIRGMAGPGDPSQDLIARPARTTYLDDLSAGVSNSFPGDGVRSLVGVCTAGTKLPARTETSPGVFRLSERDCPAKAPGRDAALISDRGATIQYAAGQGRSMINPTRGIVSADGRRLFFMSPDPSSLGVPAAGCTGTAVTSICPPQLYVRQRNADGSVVTRWLSRPVASMLGAQDASLAAPAIFEGASRDGSRVFFRTTTPLTPDDPNGQPLTPTDPRPILTGSPNANSWDLYMFELAPGNDPTGAGSSLTRISRGPDGDGDCNAPLEGTEQLGGLRFASADGRRAYFTCAAPLPGVTAPADPTRTTSPGGTPTTSDQANLYLYDDADGSAEWRFVARLPRSDPASSCATTSIGSGSPIGVQSGAVSPNSTVFSGGKCVHGNSAGNFITLWTPGTLTLDDPETASMDLYAYDAATEELIRITASQGGADAGYMCGSSPGNPASSTLCHGDPGYSWGESLPLLGLATDPPDPADRIAFFQSRSQLLPEDTDGAFDVYQWKNGALSLLSTGASVTDGAFYKGNDRSGKNVYMLTRDRLSWQDIDAVLDAYTARIGGGIPEPPAPLACDVLAGACKGAPASSPAPSPASSGAFEGPGNVAAAAGPRPCGKAKLRRGKRCVSKRALARRACAKRKGQAKRRCIRRQLRRLNRAQKRQGRAKTTGRAAR